MDVRARVGFGEEGAPPPARLVRSDDRRHTHVEVRVRLRLTVQSCEDVVEAGHDVRAADIDHAGVRWDRRGFDGSGGDDVAVADHHHRIVDVCRAAAGLRHVDDRAAGQDERSSEQCWDHAKRWVMIAA